jgi:hypothetical protein
MKFALIVILFFIVLIAGAGIFLATWDIPAPSKPAEVVIPNDRFPK